MVDLMKTLVDKGVTVDKKDVYGQNPMHIAARQGELGAVKFLIDEEADINSKTPTGKTALHIAREAGTSGRNSAAAIEFRSDCGAVPFGPQPTRRCDPQPRESGRA